MTLFNSEPNPDYEERVSFIKSKKIAVWDVIENCYREGSLDAKIREEKVNDFRALFNAYPNLKAFYSMAVKRTKLIKSGLDSMRYRIYRFISSHLQARRILSDMKRN